MPHNLDIVIPETKNPYESESKRQEAVCLRELYAQEPDITLFNPSKYVMSVVAQIPGAKMQISSAREWEDKYRNEIHEKGYSATYVRDPGNSLVYAGSLGIPVRARRWLCLQPKMSHPQVEGVQRHGWGMSYQYRRKSRPRELYFEWDPPENRYSTNDAFGVETDFFVRTTLELTQKKTSGKGRVLGFSSDGSERLHGRLGEIYDQGMYVIREDTVAPERHDMYQIERGILHYGEILTQGEHTVLDLHNHCRVRVDLSSDLPELRYATFFSRGEFSEKLLERNYGAVLSARVAYEADARATDYGAGVPIVALDFPVRARDITRERAMENLEAGVAVYRDGRLERTPHGQIRVRGVEVSYETFLRQLFVTPQRHVSPQFHDRRILERYGVHFQKFREGVYTVFPPSIPWVGWLDPNSGVGWNAHV